MLLVNSKKEDEIGKEKRNRRIMGLVKKGVPRVEIARRYKISGARVRQIILDNAGHKKPAPRKKVSTLVTRISALESQVARLVTLIG